MITSSLLPFNPAFMSKAYQQILVLCLLCARIGFAQYSPEITQLLGKVKEASYYDSTQVFNVGTQTINKIKDTKDEGAIAEVYLDYGNYFYFVRDIERSKVYMKQAVEEAKRTGNRHIEDLANIRLIFSDYEQGFKEQPEKEFESLLAHSKKVKDDENTAELLNLMGVMAEEKNQLQVATRLYLEGLMFAETHNLSHYPAVFMNNLGLMKVYTDQNDDALIDFQKALTLARKENDRRLINHIEINICLVYILKERVKEALVIFQDVLDYSRKNNHPRELSSAFVNLGSAFLNTGKPDMALSYMDSAITVMGSHHMYFELTKAYLGKAEVLVSLKRDKEADRNLVKVKELLEKTGSLEDKASYYLLSYRNEDARKNYKAALEDFVNYYKVKDSIQQNVNGKIIQELQLKFNVQKKEVELEKEKSRSLMLEKSNQEERYIKWLAIASAGVILIVLIGIISLSYSRRLHREQEQFSRQLIEKVEDERSRISRDLHDDIGQSLSIIKSQISAKADKESPVHFEHALGRVIEQTRQISKTLYPSYLEKIGLTRSVAQLMESIQAATGIECSFEIVGAIEQVPVAVKTHIYRIIQECTNNTIKHAEATALKVSIVESGDEFQMVYQDNGKGISAKETNGMGLLSIRERAKIINGFVNIDDKTQKGFKLVIKFKAKV